MIGEVRVQSSGGIISGGQGTGTEKHHGAPSGHGEAQEGQQHYRGPEESYESAVRTHGLCCPLERIRRKLGIYIGNAPRRDPANQTAVPKAAGAPASEPTVRSGMDLAPEEGNVAE